MKISLKFNAFKCDLVEIRKNFGDAVWFCGGLGSKDGGAKVAQNECRAYTWATGQWTEGPKMKFLRRRARGIMWNDGTLWVVGGRNTNNVILDSTETWTQASNWVTDTLRMPWAVEDHELVQLTDTTALIIGGVTPDNAQGRSNVFLFDKTANTYTEVNPMANPRFRHTCQKIFSTTRGEEVICVGGCPNSPKSTDIYSVSTGVWRAGPLIPDNIYDGKSVAYQNTMLVMGGTDGSGTFYTKTHEYDVVNQVWATNDAVLSEAKNDFAAILVDTSKAC